MKSPLKRKPKRPAFVMMFKSLLRDPRVSPGAKALLMGIKSYSDKTGVYCYPCQDTLAADFGISVRTVKRYVAELRAFHWMSGGQRINKDGTKSSTAFLVDDERMARIQGPRKNKIQPRATRGPRQGPPVAPGEGQNIVPFTEEKQATG